MKIPGLCNWAETWVGKQLTNKIGQNDVNGKYIIMPCHSLTCNLPKALSGKKKQNTNS